MIISQLRAGAAYELTDMALLSGSSLIYSPSLETGYTTFPLNLAQDLLQEEVMDRLRRTVRNDRVEFDFLRPVQRIGHLSQPAVPLNLIHPYNYFHFLIEALPSLVWLLDRKVVADDFVLVTGRLHPNMWTALNHIIGPNALSILQLRLMQTVTCDKVVTAPPAAHAAQLVQGGTTDWQYNAEKLNLLRGRFQRELSAAAREPRRKLYVRRVSRVRNLSNAAEVEAAVKAAGYAVVQPETMGFFDQVRLFASASHIIGPTGAWAANLLFAPQDCRAAVFYPDAARIEKAVWDTMAATLGIHVRNVYCPVTTLRPPPFEIHSDFTATPEIMADLLNAQG
ncbi:glycosyltransferase family 61 protein [Phenylobacterium sp.]|uniref:glycosyltransferase family 61 protein n=1 Tax=Phenylobacterium sp. TaxID=1871053 RepID=UPI0025D52914|nr:glycosyltransferase family 61 protein [Phenylobacterium sp.]